MPTFTSRQDGPWSAPSTWGGSGPPTAVDGALVLHAVDYDATLTHVGAITVRGAGHLRLRADLKLAGTAVLRCDADETAGWCGRITASGAPRQILFTGGTTYRIVLVGLASVRCAVGGESPANTLTIDGYSNVDAFRGGGMIDAAFTDFTNCGSATIPALKAYGGASNGGPYRLIDCTFTNCGRLYIDKLGPSSVFTLTRVKHLNPPGASRSLYLGIYQGAGPGAGIDRTITACAFDQMAEVYAANGLVGRDIYAGNEFYSHFDGVPDLHRIFYNKPVGTVDSVCYCPIVDWYIYEADPKASNAHWISPAPGHARNPLVCSGAIFDGNQPAIRPQNGDCYLNVGSGSGSCLMTGCLVLPTAWNPTEAGTLMTLGGNANTTFAFEHNTYCCGVQGAAMGESYAGHAGMVTSFRSNLAWNDSTVTRGMKLYDSGKDDSVPDLVAAAACDYNGGWNVGPGGGSNGKGYDHLEFSAGAPGVHDVDGDPHFVDDTRNFLTWDASLGGAGTVAAAQARLRADPTLIGSSLIPYVRAGFAPQNPDFATAAHDGTTIGAIAYVAPPGDYAIFPPSPAAGMPGSPSRAFTVRLRAGFDPGGSVAITPRVAGLAGMFTPAAVTLSNTVRSATFTFTPDASATGTATIASLSAPAASPTATAVVAATAPPASLADPDPVTYQVAYPPLDLARFDADIQKIGRTYPQTPLALDTTDHYDPLGVFENIRAYTNDPSWDVPIGHALARYRGFLEDQGGNLNDVFAHNEGLYQHYLRTGDPRSRDMALTLAEWPNFAGDAYDIAGIEWQGYSREIAFTLRNQLIAERLGHAHRARTDAWAGAAIGHLNQWGSTHRPWPVYSRPFMFGFTAAALAWYWDRYRDPRIPPAMKAALDWFWDHAWDEPSQQFYYTAEDSDSWYQALSRIQASPPPTATTFAGDAGLSAVDNVYQYMYVWRPDRGVKPFRDSFNRCIGYNGTTKVFTFEGPWSTPLVVGEPFKVADDVRGTVLASPAPTTSSFTLGGPGLSAVDDFYKFAAVIVNRPSSYAQFQCRAYDGASKRVTIRGMLAAAPPVGTVITLSRYACGFNLGGGTGGQGIGAGGDLNLMVAHAYYWYYWYTVLTGRRDNTYRARGDAITLGNVSPYNQKQYNEAYKFSFWGLKWRALGDNPPEPATALVLTAPSPASGRANVPSGLFSCELNLGGTADPVTVTPADGGAGGTFNPAAVVLTTDRPSAHFRYIPPASQDGRIVRITITNDRGLGNPAGVAHAVAGTAPLATGYEIVATGAPRGPNQYSPPYELRLTPAGAVPPRAADARGGLVTLANYSGALYPLRNVTIAADRPTALMALQPDATAAVKWHTVNDAGLPDPPWLTYTAGAPMPRATGYSLVAPESVSGPALSPSGPFTVSIPDGTAPDRASFPANIVPSAGKGVGMFAPPQVKLSPVQATDTFAFTPAAVGPQTIATTADSKLTNPPGVTYTSTPASTPAPTPAPTPTPTPTPTPEPTPTPTPPTVPVATGYSLVGPERAAGPVGVDSAPFTVTLMPPGSTHAGLMIVPQSDGGGTFTPTQMTLTTALPTATFVYTPTTAGTKTITITNNGGFADPAGFTYMVDAPAPVSPPAPPLAPEPAPAPEPMPTPAPAPVSAPDPRRRQRPTVPLLFG